MTTKTQKPVSKTEPKAKAQKTVSKTDSAEELDSDEEPESGSADISDPESYSKIMFDNIGLQIDEEQFGVDIDG